LLITSGCLSMLKHDRLSRTDGFTGAGAIDRAMGWIKFCFPEVRIFTIIEAHHQPGGSPVSIPLLARNPSQRSSSL
jgi:hypothetical protein